MPRASIAGLFGCRGRLTGRSYATIGISLVLIKFAIDSAIGAAYGHTWSPLIYLRPSTGFGMLAIPEGEVNYYWTMLFAAIPFIWIGVTTTFRRLATLGMPRPLTVLFFIPVVNLFLFAILSLAHDAATEAPAIIALAPPCTPPPGAVIVPDYARPEPSRRWGSIFLAAFAPLIPALLMTAFSTHVLGSYGWGLFVGAPFAISFSAGVLYGRLNAGPVGVFMAGMLSLVFWLAGMLVLQMEGAICLLMASPLIVIMGGLGSLAGAGVYTTMHELFDKPGAFIILLLVLPTMYFEHVTRPAAPLFDVTTAIDIAAPPEKVWANVVRFPELSPPREWIFQTGVAYPTSATIAGSGIGAQRRCTFTTGTFVEPITAWAEPQLLRFDVTENPMPLQEMNPFGRVDPPHLHGFFVSRQGQFRLVSTSNGHTRLEGTTWYQHHMWPAGYWSMWSDYVVHRIHTRVLEHIRQLAEEEARPQLAKK